MVGFVVCYKCSDEFKFFSYFNSLERAENASMSYLGIETAFHGNIVEVTIFKPLQTLFEMEV